MEVFFYMVCGHILLIHRLFYYVKKTKNINTNENIKICTLF